MSQSFLEKKTGRQTKTMVNPVSSGSDIWWLDLGKKCCANSLPSMQGSTVWYLP